MLAHANQFGIRTLYIFTVFCKVVLVRRAGMPVPRWQLGSLPAHEGHLVVKDEYQKDLGRYSRIAELLPATGERTQLRLFDVVLLGTNSSWMTLAGLERVVQPNSYTDHAQTWHVTPIAPSMPGVS